MKQIELTQGQFALVDDDDFQETNKHKWYSQKMRGGSKAARKTGKYTNRKLLYMHRVIMKCPDNLQVDHINHNTLDNRKCNLRICNRSENKHNTLVSKKGSSQFKGVSWHIGTKKWVSHIRINSKLIHLGYFDKEIKAAEAYDEAAINLHKNFAVCNFERTNK